MTIIADSRTTGRGMSAMVRRQDGEGAGGGEDRALRALMGAGLSEQTAREQLARLAAGDIWSG
ncbi:hypothetical protein J2W21_000315 [Sinomonas atrocyanea]|uniref:hypothetical protein n=1 Tax=Sinomonas atrocyanea TaxID=37927 RepID=UPI00278700CA|nr:hypothetical protein [Sinomonas atrocyanea]MDP9882836.1 hypothetical protein [Sinomonas atrocyanea]